MFTTKKIAVVSVINDLVTDNRVNRTCLALVENGYDVLLIGRLLPGSMPIPNWPFKAKRMLMRFKSGPWFYIFFMFRLFFKLLFKRSHLLVANDLDTLLPNFLVSKIRGVPLIYDSHELFCDVPELVRTPLKQKMWRALESFIVPKLRHCITVNDSIAAIFTTSYKVPFVVVRNIADAPEGFVPRSKESLGLPLNQKIILLQGAGINVDRGAEELVSAMRFIENAVLLIIGGGDSWPVLKREIESLGLGLKIRMIEKLPKQELLHYTYQADLGISIDKDTNLNYHYSLPNKIFDYMQAGVPVLASRLPEITRIVEQYRVGTFIDNHEPAHIADKINHLLNSTLLAEYKANTRLVNKALNWQHEKLKLSEVIKKAAAEIHKLNT